MPVYTVSDIFELSIKALCRAGADENIARIVAQSITDAEADGIRLIGLQYLPVYCRHLRCGKVNGQAHPSITQAAPGLLRADAQHGFCHATYAAGEAQFYDMARGQGIAAFTLSQSYASGVLGWFVERMAIEGLIGLGFSNASPTMAPFGGARAVFGTNPIALAVPRGKALPLVIDFSPAATTRLEVKKRYAENANIPLGWGLDAEGRPTQSPHDVLNGGTIAPAAGHKGSAIALLVELLAAGLTGARWSFQASDLGHDTGGPPEIGQTFIAVNPRLSSGEGFGAHIEALISEMLSQDGVRLPGNKRAAHREKSKAEGIDVSPALLDEIAAAAAG